MCSIGSLKEGGTSPTEAVRHDRCGTVDLAHQAEEIAYISMDPGPRSLP